MKVLVSGASGFLGHYVVARLLERGHSVRAIVRPASPDPSWKGEIEIFRADLRVCSTCTAFDGVDALVHLAAATSGDEDVQFTSTVVGTEKLLEAMSRSFVKRLVHISSIVAYDWARAKRIIDEETPLLSDMYKMGAYNC